MRRSNTRQLILAICVSAAGFAAAAEPFALVDLEVLNISPGSALIAWKTTAPADGVVNFAEGANLTRTAQGVDGRGTFHQVMLNDLEPATRYSFRAAATDQQGNTARSDIRSFATQEPGAVDFSLTPYGPTRVFQGYSMRLGLIGRKQSEQGATYALSVDDLPVGSEASFHFWQQNRIYHAGSGVIGIQTGEQTPRGSYVLRITATTERAEPPVSRVAFFPLTVLPAPEPLASLPVASNPPIPLVEQWERQMLAFGKQHADGERIARVGAWEGGVWYYDGERVYHQIADYTGDDTWREAAWHVQGSYRDGYVLKNEGRLPGWRVFPHGLFMDYRRTGDERSREAAILMSQRSAFAARGGGVNTGLSRETAYLLNAYLVAEDLGAPRHPQFETTVDFALGHMDQWFSSRNFLAGAPNDSLAPFMAGLTAEALIGYYERSHDPRVPHIIQAALDWLWEFAWVEEDEAFYYRHGDPYHSVEAQSGAPDLNMLIAPAFAWLYRTTGDPTYRERGDRAFAGGVRRAWLGGGKQFSQNYRWSFDYVQWRREVPVAGDNPPPEIHSIQLRADNGDAIVEWKTDTPAFMQLRYGTTGVREMETPPSRYLVTAWRQRIRGIDRGKPCHIEITATDASGQTVTESVTLEMDHSRQE